LDDLKAGLDYIVGPALHDIPYLNAELNPTISEVRAPVFLLPGNHDRYRNHLGHSGGTSFDQVFSGFWGNPNPYVRSCVIQDPDSVDKLGIVAADFALRSDDDYDGPWWHRYGQGCAYTDIVNMLEKRTLELFQRYDGIGIVWMVHFPPSFEACGNLALILRNHERVIEAAQACNVRIIFSGHIHKPYQGKEGGVEVVCAGSATCYMEAAGNWLHFHELEVSSGMTTFVSSQNFRWSKERLAFV
jgi:hypothetical protein